MADNPLAGWKPPSSGTTTSEESSSPLAGWKPPEQQSEAIAPIPGTSSEIDALAGFKIQPENPLSDYGSDYRKGFLPSTADSLISGGAKFLQGVSRIPAVAVGINQLPGNLAMKYIVHKPELQQRVPEFLINNPFTDSMEQASESFAVKAKKYPNKNLGDLINEKRYGDAADYAYHSVLENLPQQVLVVGASVAGTPVAGAAVLGTLGASSAGNTLAEGRARGLDEVSNTANAGLNGTFEVVGEAFGSMGISKWAMKIMEKEVAQGGKLIVPALMKAIVGSMGAEGTEEISTQFAQDWSDKYFGNTDKGTPLHDLDWDDPKLYNEMFARALESGLVGALSGGAITAPMSTWAGMQQGKQQKVDIKFDESIELLKTYAKDNNIEFDPTKVDEISGQIKALRSSLEKNAKYYNSPATPVKFSDLNQKEVDGMAAMADLKLASQENLKVSVPRSGEMKQMNLLYGEGAPELVTPVDNQVFSVTEAQQNMGKKSLVDALTKIEFASQGAEVQAKGYKLSAIDLPAYIRQKLVYDLGTQNIEDPVRHVMSKLLSPEFYDMAYAPGSAGASSKAGVKGEIKSSPEKIFFRHKWRDADKLGFFLKDSGLHYDDITWISKDPLATKRWVAGQAAKAGVDLTARASNVTTVSQDVNQRGQAEELNIALGLAAENETLPVEEIPGQPSMKQVRKQTGEKTEVTDQAPGEALGGKWMPSKEHFDSHGMYWSEKISRYINMSDEQLIASDIISALSPLELLKFDVLKHDVSITMVRSMTDFERQSLHRSSSVKDELISILEGKTSPTNQSLLEIKKILKEGEATHSGSDAFDVLLSKMYKKIGDAVPDIKKPGTHVMPDGTVMKNSEMGQTVKAPAKLEPRQTPAGMEYPKVFPTQQAEIGHSLPPGAFPTAENKYIVTAIEPHPQGVLHWYRKTMPGEAPFVHGSDVIRVKRTPATVATRGALAQGRRMIDEVYEKILSIPITITQGVQEVADKTRLYDIGPDGEKSFYGAVLTKDRSRIIIQPAVLEMDWQAYMRGERVFKLAGVHDIPLGMSSREYMDFAIEHERVHIATGWDGSATDENMVNIVALERIGRADLSRLVIDGVMPETKAEREQRQETYRAAIEASRNLGEVAGKKPKMKAKMKEPLFEPKDPWVYKGKENEFRITPELRANAEKITYQIFKGVQGQDMLISPYSHFIFGDEVANDQLKPKFEKNGKLVDEPVMTREQPNAVYVDPKMSQSEIQALITQRIPRGAVVVVTPEMQAAHFNILNPLKERVSNDYIDRQNWYSRNNVWTSAPASKGFLSAREGEAYRVGRRLNGPIAARAAAGEYEAMQAITHQAYGYQINFDKVAYENMFEDLLLEEGPGLRMATTAGSVDLSGIHGYQDPNTPAKSSQPNAVEQLRLQALQNLKRGTDIGMTRQQVFNELRVKMRIEAVKMAMLIDPELSTDDVKLLRDEYKKMKVSAGGESPARLRLALAPKVSADNELAKLVLERFMEANGVQAVRDLTAPQQQALVEKMVEAGVIERIPHTDFMGEFLKATAGTTSMSDEAYAIDNIQRINRELGQMVQDYQYNLEHLMYQGKLTKRVHNVAPSGQMETMRQGPDPNAWIQQTQGTNFASSEVAASVVRDAFKADFDLFIKNSQAELTAVLKVTQDPTMRATIQAEIETLQATLEERIRRMMSEIQLNPNDYPYLQKKMKTTKKAMSDADLLILREDIDPYYQARAKAEPYDEEAEKARMFQEFMEIEEEKENSSEPDEIGEALGGRTEITPPGTPTSQEMELNALASNFMKLTKLDPSWAGYIFKNTMSKPKEFKSPSGVTQVAQSFYEHKNAEAALHHIELRLLQVVWDRGAQAAERQMNEKSPKGTKYWSWHKRRNQLAEVNRRIKTRAMEEFVGSNFMSDKGMGGPHLDQQEADTTVKDYTELYTAWTGKAPDPAFIASLKTTRPQFLFTSLLDEQDINLFRQTLHILDRVKDFSIAMGFFNDVNADLLTEGYSPRFAITQTEKAAGKKKGLGATLKEPGREPGTPRTYSQWFVENREGLVIIDDFASVASKYLGKYVAQGLRGSMVTHLRSIPNPENGMGLVEYPTTPIDPLTNKPLINPNTKEPWRGPDYLKSLGYEDTHTNALVGYTKEGYLPGWVHRSVTKEVMTFVEFAKTSDITKMIIGYNYIKKRSIIWALPQVDMLGSYIAYGLTHNPFHMVKEVLSLFPSFIKKDGAFDLGFKTLTGNPDPYGYWKGMDPDQVMEFIEAGMPSGREWTHRLFGASWVSAAPQDRSMIENFGSWIVGKGGADEYFFQSYTLRLNLELAQQFAEQMQRKGNLTRKEAVRNAVYLLNEVTGQVNSSSWGKEANFLSVLLFSRDYTFTMVRQITGALYALPVAGKWLSDRATFRTGKGGYFNTLLHAEKTSEQRQFLAPYYARHLARMLMLKVVFINMIQYGLIMAFGDDKDKEKPWAYQNEGVNKLFIKLPRTWSDKKGSMYYFNRYIFLDTMLFREATEIVSAIGGEFGFGKGMGQTIRGKLAPVIADVVTAVTGKDPLGNEYWVPEQGAVSVDPNTGKIQGWIPGMLEEMFQTMIPMQLSREYPKPAGAGVMAAGQFGFTPRFSKPISSLGERKTQLINKESRINQFHEQRLIKDIRSKGLPALQEALSRGDISPAQFKSLYLQEFAPEVSAFNKMKANIVEKATSRRK